MVPSKSQFFRTQVNPLFLLAVFYIFLVDNTWCQKWMQGNLCSLCLLTTDPQPSGTSMDSIKVSAEIHYSLSFGDPRTWNEPFILVEILLYLESSVLASVLGTFVSILVWWLIALRKREVHSKDKAIEQPSSGTPNCFMYKNCGPFSYEYQSHWTMVSQNYLQLNCPNSASLKSLISLSIQMIRKKV